MYALHVTLPVLKPSETVIEWNCTDVAQDWSNEATQSSWIRRYRALPLGEAFAARAALVAHLFHEEDRLQQVHADPHHLQQWTAAANDGGADAEAGAEEENDGQAGGARYQTSSTRKKKFVKLTDEDLLVDWYDVLKLEQGDGASEDQIKAAYRRRCLETHPDKQKDHSDELFKKVQRAFDILSDPDTRQTYDSSRPFDDSIPPETVEEAMFYTSFGPVFDRNKKWSSVPALPSLGTDKTPHHDVLRFYDRWNGFQTWRDFSHLADIEEIDEGMCREEKRFYMRENARQLSHFHREELKRIRQLVERARKNDPRLRRKREEEEQKRLKEIAGRDAFRLKIIAEEERRRDEEARKAEEKKQEALRLLQEEKQTMRQAQADLLEFLRSHDLLDETPTNKLLADQIRRRNVQWLFSKTPTSKEAQSVVEAVRQGATARRPRTTTQEGVDDAAEEEVEAVIIFNALIQETEQRVGLNRYGEPIKKSTDTQNQSSSKKKSGVAGGSGSAAKTASSSTVAAEWTDEDLSRLQKATAKYPPGTVDRWTKICEVLRQRFTEEQAMAKVSELTSALHRAGSGNPTVASAAASLSHPSAAGTNSSSPASPVTTASSVEDWSLKQQKQLENGLRELKDYKEKDKFQKLAKFVDDKTAKECFDRFKFLCSVNKKK